MNAGVVAAIVGAVLLYCGGLFFFIRWAVRLSKKRLERQSAALVAGLEGATRVGETTPATLYGGAETEYEVAGRRVHVSTQPQGKHYVKSSLRIAGGPFPSVTVFPESGFERFGKAIGLSREVQTGDKPFDDLAYLDTIDTEDTVRRAFESGGVRGAVTDLLSLGYHVKLGPSGVEAFVLVRNHGQVDGSKAKQAVEQLARLADALPPFSATQLEPVRQAKQVALGLLLVFSWVIGFAMLGFASSQVDRTVDPGTKVLAFVVGGGLSWALYVFLLVAGLRGRSYAMRTVTLGAVLGLLGIPAGGGALLLYLNQSLDPSAPTERVVSILEHKNLKKGRCRLTVTWEGEPRQHLYVSHSSDQELTAGTTAIVRFHPGRFGWAWHEKIRPDGS